MPACQIVVVVLLAVEAGPATASAAASDRRASSSRPRNTQYQTIELTIRTANPAAPSRLAFLSAVRILPVSVSSRRSHSCWAGPRRYGSARSASSV
ncbi:hypothetical protein OG792_22100 [Micromonospora sp. NBC_01699]|uniref:hypothetical protein n=1 Tax=Micromonospora sp. NBC_01699 TaxID=2975984 RepID=UPI002E2DDED4|nr:hypothetical protein [Micromonospora sp. NBC_01699]